MNDIHGDFIIQGLPKTGQHQTAPLTRYTNTDLAYKQVAASISHKEKKFCRSSCTKVFIYLPSPSPAATETVHREECREEPATSPCALVPKLASVSVREGICFSQSQQQPGKLTARLGGRWEHAQLTAGSHMQWPVLHLHLLPLKLSESKAHCQPPSCKCRIGGSGFSVALEHKSWFTLEIQGWINVALPYLWSKGKSGPGWCLQLQHSSSFFHSTSR